MTSLKNGCEKVVHIHLISTTEYHTFLKPKQLCGILKRNPSISLQLHRHVAENDLLSYKMLLLSVFDITAVFLRGFGVHLCFMSSQNRTQMILSY